jgi:catechol 2,3-dioxygenase-like lactoylglutathione lyase family enzyme
VADNHIQRITEISIAVRDLDQAVADMGGALGLETYAEVSEELEPPVQARFQGFGIPGSAVFGLMESAAENSPIDRFVERRGEGIFSISLEVDDIEATMGDWRERGIEFVLDEPMVTDGPVAGSHWDEIKINFTRPNPLLHGVVFEIQELVRPA